MPKWYVFQFFVYRHFHFSQFVHIFHNFSTFSFAWPSSKNFNNNLYTRYFNRLSESDWNLDQYWSKPMKMTAIRVIELPPIILSAQPSSILKSIVTCSAEFRIKLLFSTFFRSEDYSKIGNLSAGPSSSDRRSLDWGVDAKGLTYCGTYRLNVSD